MCPRSIYDIASSTNYGIIQSVTSGENVILNSVISGPDEIAYTCRFWRHLGVADAQSHTERVLAKKGVHC